MVIEKGKKVNNLLNQAFAYCCVSWKLENPIKSKHFERNFLNKNMI